MRVTKTILALISLALLGRVAAAEDEPRQLLDQLCRLDEHAPQVNRISEVKSMATLLVENNRSNCDSKVVDAIKRLALVIEPANQNVCLPESIDAIIDFHRDFSDGNLPKSLKRFFLAYGLQVSWRCKRLMIAELCDASKRANIENQEEFGFVIDTARKVEKFFDHEIPVENLLAVVDGDKSKKYVRIMYNMIRLPVKRTINEVRDKCREKFMPVYNVLVMPIVRLAAIGINYKGHSIDTRLEELQKRVEYSRWFAAVLICESTKQSMEIGENRPAYPYQIAAELNDLIVDEDSPNLQKVVAELKYSDEMKKFKSRMAARGKFLVGRKIDLALRKWLSIPTI